MKKILLILTLFLFTTKVLGQANNLNEVFDQFQDKEGVTSIKIAKPMFKMLGSLKIDDDDLNQLRPLLNKVNSLKILIFENSNDKAQNETLAKNYSALKSSIMSSISSLKYEELMTVNSKDNKIKFLVKNVDSGVLDNLILNISSKDNMVLMLLDGKISMDDVSGLIEQTQNVSSVNPLVTVNQDNLSSERKVGVFTGVEVANGIIVDFIQSPQQSVVVKVDADKQKYIVTEVEKGILKIFVKSNNERNLRLNNLKVYVSAPTLVSVSTKSGASFKAKDEINTSNLSLSSASGSSIEGEFEVANQTIVQLTSGSNMKIDLETKSISASVTSGSSFKIKGKADSGIFNGTSASSISALDFEVKSLVVDATSASNIKVNVSESLVANATSAASIQYKGSPEKVIKSAKEITGSSITQIK